MVDSVIRRIKLPGKGVVNIKVPSDWTPERLKQELISRGDLPSEGGFVKSISEIPGAILHGAENAIEQNAHSAAEDRKSNQELLKSRFGLEPSSSQKAITDYLSNVDTDTSEEPSTTTGQVTKAISQFLTGATLNPVAKAGTVARALQGAIADYSSFDPEKTKTLSTTLNKFPVLSSLVPDFLVSDPNDTHHETRLKLAAEGLGIGALIEHAIIPALKSIKSIFSSRLVKAVPPEETKPTLALPPPKKEVQVDSQGNANLVQSPVPRIEGQLEHVGKARNEADELSAKENIIAEAKLTQHKEDIARQATFDKIQAEQAKIKQGQVEESYAQRTADRKEAHTQDLIDRVSITPKLKFGGKQSGQVDPAVFREGIKKIYDSVTNFSQFVKKGKAQYGSEFEPVAESLYRSVRADSGEIPQQATPRKRQGGYNPNKLNTTEEIKQYTDELVRKHGKSKEVKTWAQTKAKASEIGMSHQQIVRLRNESKNWTARVKAAHDASLDSWTATQQHAIKAVDGTPEDLRVFYQKMLEDSELMNSIVGIRSESGRLLNSLKVVSESRGDVTEAFRKHMESSGGLDSLRSIAQKVAESGDAATGRRIARKAIKEPTLVDAVLEYWMNWGLLSGPQTHIVNYISNGLFQAIRVGEVYGTAAIGQLTRSSDRMSFAQANKYALAYRQSGRDALSSMRKTFSSDDAIIVSGNREIRDEAGRIELDAHRAWSANTFSRYLPSTVTRNLPESTRKTVAKWTDKSGGGIRLPGKTLYAGDAFWKTFGYRAKLNQLAMDETEKLLKAGRIKKEDMGTTYQGLVDNPTNSMHKASLEYARYLTFTDELGKAGKLLQAGLSEIPILKIGIPFVRTTLNMLKRTTERTPLGFLTLKNDLAAGGRLRDEALSKILIGTSVGTVAWEMAAGGTMTAGAPRDPISRQNFYESGKIPYAVKIGNDWISIARLGPIADVMSMAAATQQVAEYMTNDEQDKVAGALAVAIGDVVINKTYMESLSSLVEAVTKPDQYGSKWLHNFIGSFVVPNAAAQIARDIDPHIKQVQTITDAVKQRIPGYRDEVVDRLNRWGEPLELNGNMLNPFWDSRATDSKFLQSMYDNDIRVGMPGKIIDGITLSPRLYNQYVQFGRIPARKQLEDMYDNGTLSKASPEIQQKIVQEVVRTWDNYAKQRMEALPELIELRVKKQIDAANAFGTPEKERFKYEAK